ncbi:protocatechuate 3,4-dioxygenase [Cyanothece sp. BG0011]|uniref:protocatechuate 3,4-dioxygenase n=1 Tax=Cyanothece sp. BG0011 TaxID=2082950 RepID=UPI000D1F7C09|nr:protocatechuate 3,4-dioxygenase [Cyanothece sp. BG0011]
MKLKRRQLFKQIKSFSLGYLTLPLAQINQQYTLTPQQIEGPFYPVNFPLDDDNDLTWINDRKNQALGEKIIISGKLLTQEHQPISAAKVEIWQACASGRYNHPYDPNQAPIDPNFQGWGWTTTRQDGSYLFKTVKPGGYPVTGSWKRPPHIHFKVTLPRQKELITQLYFSEEKTLNETDKILQRIPIHQQPLVITNLIKNESLKMRIGEFNIVI